MMGEKIQNVRSGMAPWLRVLLLLSLAINLLVVGLAVGAMVKWSKWRSDHPARMEMGVGPLTRALSHDDRKAIARDMRAAQAKGHVSRAEMRVELQGLVQDLKAVPYDPDVVEQRLTRHRAGFEERLSLGVRLLQARLAQMTPEDRAAYADRLEDVLERRRPHKRKASETE